ncbi:hypothetical protein GCM10023353_25870 [Tomitella cavernea]|uniref:Uncharacterized protein n=1 Tax=Tomitella cavernea TaxID=1387982 RepID=A0ABP9CW97_9ACTN
MANRSAGRSAAPHNASDRSTSARPSSAAARGDRRRDAIGPPIPRGGAAHGTWPSIPAAAPTAPDLIIVLIVLIASPLSRSHPHTSRLRRAGPAPAVPCLRRAAPGLQQPGPPAPADPMPGTTRFPRAAPDDPASNNGSMMAMLNRPSDNFVTTQKARCS